jgi:hypothetical protein
MLANEKCILLPGTHRGPVCAACDRGLAGISEMLTHARCLRCMRPASLQSREGLRTAPSSGPAGTDLSALRVKVPRRSACLLHTLSVTLFRRASG